jgi:hypothetical protein
MQGTAVFKISAFLSGFLRIVALIIAVTAVFAFPVSLVSAGTGRALADKELVVNLVREHLVESDQVYKLILQEMSLPDERGDNGSSPGIFQVLLEHVEPAERLWIIKLLVPEEWIAVEMEANINAIYEWLQYRADYPRFSFQTRELSAAITREKAERIADGLILSWPECSPDVILHIHTGELSPGEILDYRCSPPVEFPRDMLVGAAAESIMMLFNSLPDELVFNEPVEKIQREEINETRSRLNRLLTVLVWLWLFPVFLLGLVMAMQIRSWRSLGLWWGIPLFSSGILALPGGLFIGSAGRVFLGIIQQNAEISLPLIQILKPFLRDLLVSSRPLVLFMAFCLIATGGLLILFAVIRPWSGKTNQSESQERATASGFSELSHIGTSSLQDDNNSGDDHTPSGMFG